VAGFGAVSGGVALFVVGEEGCFFEAGPEGFAFGGKRFDLVEVGEQGEGGAVGGAEPVGEGPGGAGGEGDDGVAPERAVGFLVVGEGVVAGDASPQSGAPHRRSMGGTPRASAISRAAACALGCTAPQRRVDEVEFGGGQREWFPVEAAFEQEGTSGVLVDWSCSA